MPNCLWPESQDSNHRDPSHRITLSYTVKQVIREGDEPKLAALPCLQSPMLLSKLGLIPTSLSQNRLMQLTSEPQAHSSGLYRNNPKLPGLTWYNSIVSHRGHHYEQGKDAFSLPDVSFGSWFYPWNTAQVPTRTPSLKLSTTLGTFGFIDSFAPTKQS